MTGCTRMNCQELTLTLRSLRACPTAFSLLPPAASQARLASALDKGTALLFCPSWPSFPPEEFVCALGSCWQDTAITQISSSTCGSSAFSQSYGVTLLFPDTHILVYTSSGLTPFFSPSWEKTETIRLLVRFWEWCPGYNDDTNYQTYTDELNKFKPFLSHQSLPFQIRVLSRHDFRCGWKWCYVLDRWEWEGLRGWWGRFWFWKTHFAYGWWRVVDVRTKLANPLNEIRKKRSQNRNLYSG